MEDNTKPAADIIATITPDDVRAVYSGKQGCMCGCKGSYRYNPKHRVEAGEDRGYPIGKDELNMAQVKRVLKLLQADPRVMVQDGYIFFIPEKCLSELDRRYVIYLSKSGAGGGSE